MTTFSLILPAVPELTSSDVANAFAITTPDFYCVKNIDAVLASFPSITEAFI